MNQLAFTTEYLYPDETDGITIPTYLSYGDKNIVVNAKLDTHKLSATSSARGSTRSASAPAFPEQHVAAKLGLT